MSRVLLDTTLLIDADRAGRDLGAAVDDDDDVAIAAVTVAELHASTLLTDESRREARTSFLREVLEVIPVIDYDVEVARAHAVLLVEVRRQERPRGAHDLIIAATALQSGRTVVTADTRAFVDLPGVETRSYR